MENISEKMFVSSSRPLRLF